MAKFQAAGIQPFGVNPAGVEAHASYVKKLRFNFPLLSDPHPAIARASHALKDDRKGIPRPAYAMQREGTGAVARERFGGLDGVVNVAGGLVSYGPVLDLKPDRLELELAINIKTAFYVSQAAIPALRDRGGGAMVNFASAAVLKPQSQLAAYTAAKSAVAGLTRALARELRDDRIRVNAVAPGTMKTADNLAQMQGAKVRWVELDELVAAVLYLASDEAHGVSGEILAVTGGDV